MGATVESLPAGQSPTRRFPIFFSQPTFSSFVPETCHFDQRLQSTSGVSFELLSYQSAVDLLHISLNHGIRKKHWNCGRRRLEFFAVKSHRCRRLVRPFLPHSHRLLRSVRVHFPLERLQPFFGRQLEPLANRRPVRALYVVFDHRIGKEEWDFFRFGRAHR